MYAEEKLKAEIVQEALEKSGEAIPTQGDGSTSSERERDFYSPGVSGIPLIAPVMTLIPSNAHDVPRMNRSCSRASCIAAIFEKATADYRLDRAEAPLMLYGEKKARPFKVPGADGYQAELTYFLKCVRNGTPPEVVTAEAAAESIRLVEAEVKSVQTGRTVKF